ncbi:MAG: hypothetical protein GX279_03805 [Clostridiaceae bacterium]|nr:hypothetical protein [Clostridiaceae bacterium]
MRRPFKKGFVVLCTIGAIIASYCSPVYADAVYEPSLMDMPVSVYIIALLIIAVVVTTVLIIRKNWRKNRNTGNGRETDGSKEDSVNDKT